jgi:alkylated DNA repair dioxygenase AlkB
MSQLDLFGTDVRTLADDEWGTIVYHRSVLTAERSAALFEHLVATVPWKSERRMMYEREVDVPRLVGSCSAANVRDFGLDDVLPIVESLAKAHFTRIGINFYRDGRDSVAPHNDTLGELATGAPIALLSLGAVRRMTIRSKAAPKRILDLDLESGSLLVMSYETQHNYDHGIPKTAAHVGPRISLAFRAASQ